ncbi:MAG: thioredoxin domain-containing protein [Negativicutes bacterium]|nr:thioredoxin domain-containing protein [Negativicutes bacterium]
MSRRYCTIISALAFSGAVVAGYLTYLHYYPTGYAEFILCGSQTAGNCDSLSQSEFATIFGLPVAAYGLFMFLLILFTALVADYAGGAYYTYGLALNLLLLALSMAADAVLAGVMIWLKTFCFLCLLTYAINLLLFLTAWMWYRHLKDQEGISLRIAFRSIMTRESDGPEQKAVASLYVLFVFLLAFAVFSTSYVLQMKTLAFRQSKEQMQQVVADFYRQEAEKLELPPSLLTTGPAGAKVQIIAFTDFLCSACYQFFRLEKELTAKYGDKIAFAYYNYPLDQECNQYVRQTVYKSSCTAAKAMLASALTGVFPVYLEKHFSRYNDFHGKYDRDKALETVAGLIEPKWFMDQAESAAVQQLLQRDIELAEKMNIKATPTIFINGRRLEGVPPREVVEMIVQKELKVLGSGGSMRQGSGRP